MAELLSGQGRKPDIPGSGPTSVVRRPDQWTEKLPLDKGATEVGEQASLAPYGVADDVMSVPKLTWDGKVNVATLAIILAGILAIGAQQAQQLNAREIISDHEARIRVVEGQSGPLGARLAAMEEQLKGIDRIERRLEERK